jgi:hypothetical protein
MRIRVAWIVCLAIGLLAVTGRQAVAQDSSIDSQVIETRSAAAATPAATAAVAEVPTDAPLPELSSGKQPAWFLPIHLFSVAVQGLDAHSTLRTLEHRGLDVSPLYKGMTGNKAAFLAVKAGTAVAVVYATTKIARHHRLGAVVTAAAINSVYLTMAARNYRSVRLR